MTYGDFEAQILFEYPETDPTYLNNLIRRVLEHINNLVTGRYIEEKMIKFASGVGTASTGYTWTSPVLTLPAGLTVDGIYYLDSSNSRRFELNGYDWRSFWDSEATTPVFHWMNTTGIQFSSSIIAAACEIWVKGKKHVALAAVTSPTTVLTIPADWIPVIEAGVLTELSAGTDKWKTRLPVYREMLASLRNTEAMNYPDEVHGVDYDYGTCESNVLSPEPVDDGIHNWWAP